MRHAILAALFAAAGALPAQAALEVKAQPLAQDNVIEFAVISVATPQTLPNYCTVAAIVKKVWEGTAYRTGQPVVLDVPCAHNKLIPANAWNDGFTPVNVRSLEQSVLGIARLDDKGRLIWQAGLQQYGMWGAVAGYRVLDVRLLPARPTQS